MNAGKWLLGACLAVGLHGTALAVVEGAEAIGLVAAGGVSAEVQAELKAHMEQYLPCPVQVLPAAAPAGAETIEAEAAALSPLAEGLRGVVGLVSAREAITSFGACLPEQRVAVVNVTALSQDEAKTLHRLKKESMRCAGLLLNLKPCPDQRCCMFHYRDLEGLDAKGGNFCPPCVMQLQSAFPDWQPYGDMQEEAAPATPVEAAPAAEPAAVEPATAEPMPAEAAAPEAAPVH